MGILIPLVGGVLGYFAETVHRRAGVWTVAGEMPLWIALVYALGIAGLQQGFRRFERHHSLAVRAWPLEAALLVMLFLLPPLLFRHELLLTLVAGGYLLARLWLRRASGDVKVALTVAVTDVALEGGLVAFGLYQYAETRAPLPLWLAPLWGGMALSLRRLFKLTG